MSLADGPRDLFLGPATVGQSGVCLEKSQGRSQEKIVVTAWEQEMGIPAPLGLL